MAITDYAFIQLPDFRTSKRICVNDSILCVNAASHFQNVTSKILKTFY